MTGTLPPRSTTARPSGPPAPPSGPFVESGPPEGARERVNRRWAEILQETRVAQTGGQILFGLLLSIAFSSRFHTVTGFDRVLYVITLVLGASSTAALIAPVAIHRCLCGLRMKHEVAEAAGRMTACGLWFCLCWYVLPLRLRRRAAARAQSPNGL